MPMKWLIRWDRDDQKEFYIVHDLRKAAQWPEKLMPDHNVVEPNGSWPRTRFTD